MVKYIATVYNVCMCVYICQVSGKSWLDESKSKEHKEKKCIRRSNTGIGGTHNTTYFLKPLYFWDRITIEIHRRLAFIDRHNWDFISRVVYKCARFPYMSSALHSASFPISLIPTLFFFFFLYFVSSVFLNIPSSCCTSHFLPLPSFPFNLICVTFFPAPSSYKLTHSCFQLPDNYRVLFSSRKKIVLFENNKKNLDFKEKMFLNFFFFYFR